MKYSFVLLINSKNMGVILYNRRVLSEYSKLINSGDGRFMKLLCYTDKLLKSYGIEGRAQTAEDIINDVVLRIASGFRKWNPEDRPDLLQFIRVVIKSHIKNFSYKEHIFLKPAAAKDPEMQAKTDDEFFHFVEIHAVIRERDLEQKLQSKQLKELCLKLLQNDKRALKVMIELSEGAQRKEICSELNLTAQNVNAAIMKLRRKLKPLIKEYRSNGNVDTEKTMPSD